MECELYYMCENRNSIENGCDSCQYNIYAELQDNFKFNGNGEEPTQRELDEILDEVYKFRARE